MLLRRVLRRRLVRVLIETEVLRRVLRRGGGCYRRRLEGRNMPFRRVRPPSRAPYKRWTETEKSDLPPFAYPLLRHVERNDPQKIHEQLLESWPNPTNMFIFSGQQALKGNIFKGVIWKRGHLKMGFRGEISHDKKATSRQEKRRLDSTTCWKRPFSGVPNLGCKLSALMIRRAFSLSFCFHSRLSI